MKKIFCAVIAALLLSASFSLLFVGADGTEENSINWSYDEESRRLEITGRGEITETPWRVEDVKPTSLVIGEGITRICGGAFADMISIEAITLPYSIEEVGHNAFYNTYYYNHPQNREGGVLYIGSVLVDALPGSQRSYAVKEGTRCIADFAFEGCENLVSVTLPSGVTHIGNYAFDGCTSLKRLTLPSTLAFVGTNATNYTESLESVTYKGTPDEFARVFIEYGNENLRAADINFAPDSGSDTTAPSDDGKKPAGLLGGCSELAPATLITALAFACAAAFIIIRKK